MNEDVNSVVCHLPYPEGRMTKSLGGIGAGNHCHLLGEGELLQQGSKLGATEHARIGRFASASPRRRQGVLLFLEQVRHPVYEEDRRTNVVQGGGRIAEKRKELVGGEGAGEVELLEEHCGWLWRWRSFEIVEENGGMNAVVSINDDDASRGRDLAEGGGDAPEQQFSARGTAVEEVAETCFKPATQQVIDERNAGAEATHSVPLLRQGKGSLKHPSVTFRYSPSCQSFEKVEATTLASSLPLLQELSNTPLYERAVSRAHR